MKPRHDAREHEYVNIKIARENVVSLLGYNLPYLDNYVTYVLEEQVDKLIYKYVKHDHYVNVGIYKSTMGQWR